jgi:hypothetical protein
VISRILTAAVASAAFVAVPALAKPGGGQGQGQANAPAGSPAGPAMDARINSVGPANASPNGIENSSPNSVLQTNPVTTDTPPATNPATGTSQGPANASPNGIARANSRSVLAGGAVAADTLPGLTTGLTVQSSTGTEIGTVSQVVTGSDGSIRMVIVTSPSGETFRLMPTTLSISGDVVTTTSTDIGG